MALMAPVFVVPTLTFLFWLFGGGSITQASNSREVSGLNTSVPESQSQEIVSDKLEAYKNAEREQERQQKLTALDEYAFPDETLDPESESSNIATRRTSTDPAATELNQKVTKFYESPSGSSNAKEIDRRIREMERKQATAGLSDEEYINRELAKNPYTKEIERQMMQNSGSNNSASSRQKRNVMEVSSSREKKVVSSLTTTRQDKPKKRNSFYTSGTKAAAANSNTLSAAIHQDQTVVNGSTVKLRLLNDISINGVVVPKNTFVYGSASLSAERLNIEITSIRYKNDILPVNLNVYDVDGIEGVSIPGSQVRTAGKEAMADGAQSIGNGTIVAPTAGGQIAVEAANAGIGAVKSLAGKKAKQVKVFVKANYRVFLK